MLSALNKNPYVLLFRFVLRQKLDVLFYDLMAISRTCTYFKNKKLQAILTFEYTVR